ncbi:hypothetical protein TNCV_1408841 [Trichonephila clavipes]|uniref:Uncharacterized protein n=1 Tax=Trichonephila clavipes TaxID=2585209 RepID=A0A8X6UP28_TRICX|nr:hypothetical protein TNCV_1408841 [Trichonephila clavipes]
MDCPLPGHSSIQGRFKAWTIGRGKGLVSFYFELCMPTSNSANTALLCQVRRRCLGLPPYTIMTLLVERWKSVVLIIISGETNIASFSSTRADTLQEEILSDTTDTCIKGNDFYPKSIKGRSNSTSGTTVRDLLSLGCSGIVSRSCYHLRWNLEFFYASLPNPWTREQQQRHADI